MRNAIRREIESVKPCDAVEVGHRGDALAWIASGAPLWRIEKPAVPPKHLVSYFAVVDGDRILLVDYKNAQMWLPTGGHVEPDEHPRQTVAREIHEELGFAIPHEVGPPIMITCDTTVGLSAAHTDVCLWYLVRASQRIRHDEKEFHRVQWFDFADIPVERCHQNIRCFVAKLRRD
jgi:8-oxo-dGTP diphosphatase